MDKKGIAQYGGTLLRRRMPYPACPGFTLVETMMVLAVAAMLLSIAVPAIRSLTNSMAVTSTANELLGDLYLARSEAIKRRNRVALCKSADGASCSKSGGWHQGWLVFLDADNDGLRQPGEVVLNRRSTLPSALRLTGNLNVAAYVSYTPTGGTRMTSGAFQAGALTVCEASASSVTGRQIVVNATGRPRVQKVTLEGCP
jgi:type IV fimbrial biogenesis protein FimT